MRVLRKVSIKNLNIGDEFRYYEDDTDDEVRSIIYIDDRCVLSKDSTGRPSLVDLLEDSDAVFVEKEVSGVYDAIRNAPADTVFEGLAYGVRFRVTKLTGTWTDSKGNEKLVLRVGKADSEYATDSIWEEEQVGATFSKLIRVC